VVFNDGNILIRTTLTDNTEKQEAEAETQYLAHSIKSITEIITITDNNDRFTFVNQAFCNIYGYACDEIIGKHVKILSSPNNPPELLKEILENSHRESWKGEILNITKEGREFLISLQTSHIKNEKGEIIGLVGISQDITERKQAELELRKSEEKYHAIFEATGTATLIVEEDTTISMANKECIRLTGYKQEELIGTKWVQYVEPGSLQEMLKNHNLRRQNPGLSPKNYEVRLINKKGEVRDAILDIETIPITKQSIVSILDISDRKQNEKALEEGKLQLSNLVSNLPGFVYRCNNDHNWTMTFISEGCRKITGYSPEDLMNNNIISFNDIILPKYQDYLWQKWQKLLKEKLTFEDEYEILTASGEIIWVWERGNGIFNHKGELLYIEGYIEDITERKIAEELL
jgi:PAS domain S-box-containing protein